MKRITEYRKVFGSDKDTDLKTLKRTYRNLVKEWHPDKFQAGDPRAEEAEEKSRQIVDAYHFLVSIAPETHEANKAEFNETINKAGIEDYNHKKQVLQVSFLDGTHYEFFGVPEKLFVQMYNADKPLRFAKRKIFNSFLYRKSKRDTVSE